MNSTHSSFMPTLENRTFPLFPLWFLATGLYMTLVLDQQLLAQVLVEIYWSRKSTTLKLFKLKFSACLGTQPASHVPHNAGVCSIPQLRLRSSKWEFLKISTNSGTVWEFVNSVAIPIQLIDTLTDWECYCAPLQVSCKQLALIPIMASSTHSFLMIKLCLN